MTGPTVLWLTLATRRAASSRVRAFEMSDGLVAHGVKSTALVGSGLSGRIRAVRELLRQPRAVVILQKLLYGRLMLAFVRRRARMVVFECDDALQLGYPGESSAASAARARLQQVLERADLVTTSSPLLASDLIPRSGRVVWYPGPAPPRRAIDGERGRVLLWLGSASTSPHLHLLGPLAAELSQAGWTCIAVGARPEAAERGWNVLPWSEAVAATWLSRAAVGVMPQESSAWDDRKAGYKILQYAAAGVVPVASDVPPARVLLGDPPLSDLLVPTGDDWRRAIESGRSERERWLGALGSLVDLHSRDSCVEALLGGLRRADTHSV